MGCSFLSVNLQKTTSVLYDPHCFDPQNLHFNLSQDMKLPCIFQAINVNPLFSSCVSVSRLPKLFFPHLIFVSFQCSFKSSDVATWMHDISSLFSSLKLWIGFWITKIFSWEPENIYPCLVNLVIQVFVSFM